MQHDRDMAQCTQLIQTSLNPSPAPPSPSPIIWTPLVQAPLQAAAATTPLALALAHQTQLPPILFHHPVVSASLKDPPGHPKKVYASANGCGSVPGSPTCSGKVRTVLEAPTLASLRTPQLSAGPLSPTTVSQPIFTSSLQPLGLQPPHLQQLLHAGVASVFPVSHTAVSYACPARTSSQPFQGATTTPPLSVGLLPQGLPGRLGSRFPAPSASTICPLISGSVGPILNHLQQTTQTSMQQWGYSHERSIRTSGGPNLPHFPLICPSLFSGGCTQPGPLAGAAASLAQHSLAGLQSGFLPQVLPEHSALASLAQYGSADASPCYTPPVHSPSLQSPSRGRTFPHTELPSTVDSQIPVPATAPRPDGVPGTPANRPETTGGIFSQEIKTISGSYSSIHQDRPGATGGPSEGNPGLSGSFFSSVDISKPCNPPPGPAAPFSWTRSGPETQNPSAGVHPPQAKFPEAGRRDSDLPDDS